ncbi:MAG: uracil-DNA glycosylase [Elusimicrobiaceae bacterium]
MTNEYKKLVRELKNFLKYNDLDEFSGSLPVYAPAEPAKKTAPSAVKAAPVVPAQDKPVFKRPAPEPAFDKPVFKKPAAESAGKKPVVPAEDLSGKGMAELEKMVARCKKCPLGATRLKSVFGMGNDAAKIIFIGEGPGYEEDRQGLPFVGKAGILLDKMLAAMGLDRTKVYIANIAKCHPMIDPSDPEKRGNDRPPSPEEIATCRPYIERQIELIRPDFIVALGATSARALLNSASSLSSLRGTVHDYPRNPAIKIIATYHPAALLRNEAWKRPAWEDMKLLMRSANITPPGKG